MGKFMILARRAQPIVAGGKAQRRPRCWAIDEFFAGNRQAKLPCVTRALWDALSARQDNNGRAEPGAPLPLCPRLLWRWSFGPEHKRPNTRAVGLPRKLSSFENYLGSPPPRRLLPRPVWLHGGTVTLRPDRVTTRRMPLRRGGR